MWTAIGLDPLIALILKAVVLLHIMIAPFSLVHVPIDLTAVYVAGFACGAACLTIDSTLGLLVITAVIVSMVTINRAKTRRPRPPSEDPLMYATDVVATLPVPVRSLDDDRASESAPAPASVPKSEPEPKPKPASAPEPTQAAPRMEQHDRDAMHFYDDDHENEHGHRFLLKPDGVFVTDESLERAQSNRVGPDSAYCPLGKESYGVQGVASGVSVVPMTW